MSIQSTDTKSQASGLTDNESWLNRAPKYTGEQPSHPRCPVCGQLASKAVEREVRRVWLGDYYDEAGHIWSSKWLAMQVGAAA